MGKSRFSTLGWASLFVGLGVALPLAADPLAGAVGLMNAAKNAGASTSDPLTQRYIKDAKTAGWTYQPAAGESAATTITNQSVVPLKDLPPATDASTVDRAQKLMSAADQMVAGKAAATATFVNLLDQYLNLSLMSAGMPGDPGVTKTLNDLEPNMLAEAGQLGAWKDAALQNLKGSAYLRGNFGQTGPGIASGTGSGGSPAAAGGASGSTVSTTDGEPKEPSASQFSAATQKLLAAQGINGQDIMDRLLSGELKNGSDLRSALGLPAASDGGSGSAGAGPTPSSGTQIAGTDNAGSEESRASAGGGSGPASPSGIFGFFRREPALLISNSQVTVTPKLARTRAGGLLDLRFRAWIKKNQNPSGDLTTLVGLTELGILPARRYQNIFQIAHHTYRGFQKYQKTEGVRFAARYP